MGEHQGGLGSKKRALSVREARRVFFSVNGFGADGGYDAPWADASFGPVAYRVPNLRARAAALRIHDLHHLVTGYPTDWRGEAEISAWELGSGWGRYPYAWIIAIFGLLSGLLAQPRASWRAFVRGRQSENLYREPDVEVLLDGSLDELTRRLSVPPRDASLRARPRDALTFAGLGALALLFGVVSLPLLAALVGLGELRRASRALECPTRCAA